MPQKRIENPSFYPTAIFHADVLRFVRRWPHGRRVNRDEIEALELMALDTRFAALAAANGNPALIDSFHKAPDLTLAILTLIRRKWRKLDNSPYGRLKKFFATEVSPSPIIRSEEHTSELQSRFGI